MQESVRTFPNPLALPGQTPPRKVDCDEMSFRGAPVAGKLQPAPSPNLSCSPEHIKRFPTFGQRVGTFWNGGRS